MNKLGTLKHIIFRNEWQSRRNERCSL